MNKLKTLGKTIAGSLVVLGGVLMWALEGPVYGSGMVLIGLFLIPASWMVIGKLLGHAHAVTTAKYAHLADMRRIGRC